MKCPVDNTALMMSDRQGIEIDYCPDCRGIWLDRGELDKLIEKAAPAPTVNRGYDDHHSVRSHSDHDDRRHHSDDNYRHDNHHKKHKKEGFLGEIFDF